MQEKHVEKTIKQLKGKKEKWVSGAGLNNETIEMFGVNLLQEAVEQRNTIKTIKSSNPQNEEWSQAS